MAFTRSMLKGLGIEPEKIDTIIEAHTESLEGLKGQRDDLQTKLDEIQEQASKVPDLEKQVEELKAKVPEQDFEAKYNEEHEAFESYKVEVAKERADMEKANLYRAILLEKGIAPKHADSILKVADLSELTVENGAIKDREAVAEAIGDEWKDFIPTTSTKGADVEDPPANVGDDKDKANERAVQIAKERHEKLYGKSEE